LHSHNLFAIDFFLPFFNTAMNRSLSPFRSFLLIYIIAPFFASCFGNWAGAPNIVSGSGIAKTEIRTVPAFTRIDNQSIVDIEITTKKAQTLELTADDNLLQHIKTEVVGGALVVSNKDWTLGWSASVQPRLKISMEMLEAITNGGVGNITASPVETTRLIVALSGVGNITANDVKVQELTSTVSGVGRLQMQGEAERTAMGVSGTGSIQARTLAVQNANVSVSGAGSAHISVLQTLDATVSGVGNIVYYGTPRTINRTVTGVGSIRQGN
jgi:hypothetical protein